GHRHTFYLTPRDIVLSFQSSTADEQLALSLRFVGANARVEPQGTELVGGEVNYLHGNDPAAWRTGLRRFGQVVYRELWPGIDLRLRDTTGTLKYEFHVRPGADPSLIQLAYRGADSLAVDRTGALSIGTVMGTLKDAPPFSYQVIDGVQVPVWSGYDVRVDGDHGERAYGFTLGAGYRRDTELVIDPGLEYSTFLGGSSDDIGNGIKVDGSGNAFIVGTTQSPNFPTTAGALRRTGATNNSLEAFVTKVNATGTALIYSTFIGGSNFEWGRGIAIDAAGNAYVTGQTKSSNFPTTGGAFDRTFNIDTCPRCGIDQEDAFVLKLNPAGSALVYSTFLGGFNMDDGMAIAVDAAGNAYVAGETEAVNFPTTANAFDRTINGAFDTFVTKLNATGSALVYSTYLGGSAVEFPSRVAVDAAGNLFIAGSTSSTDFPTTAGAFDRSQNGAFDVFLTKVNAAGSGLVFSTFLGGSGFDSAGGLALDSAGNSYVSGGAGSVDFPSTPGAFDTLTDGDDAFVTKFNPSGSALVYSTFLVGRRQRPGAGRRRQRVGDRRDDVDRLPDHRRRGRQHAQRHVRRLRLRVEQHRHDAPLLHVPRRLGRRGGQRHRRRHERRRLRHRSHVLAQLPDHRGRVRHRLERRHAGVLGGRLRQQDRRGVLAAVDAAGSGRAGAPLARERRHRTAADQLPMGGRLRRGVVHDSNRRLERVHRAA